MQRPDQKAAYELNKARVLELRMKPGYKSWQCKCPICGATHKKRLFWTGRAAVPPINCDPCVMALDNIDTSTEFRLNSFY